MQAYFARLSTLYRNWCIRRLEARISKLRAKLLRLRPLQIGSPIGSIIGSITGDLITKK